MGWKTWQPTRAEKNSDSCQFRSGADGAALRKRSVFERLIRGVAPGAGEQCRGGKLAVVDGIVKVGVVAVRDRSDRASVEEVVQDVGGVGVDRIPDVESHLERLAANSGAVEERVAGHCL